MIHFQKFGEPYVSKGACTVPKGKYFTRNNRLYRERCLFLTHTINTKIGNQLAGLFIYLGIQDDPKDIFFFLNSPGGGIISGLAIYDSMQVVRPDTQTICVGLAASMACFLLVGGTITKRLAFPHAWRQRFFPQNHE